MSRWHAPSCSNPRIVVQQYRPHCESCNCFPDIDGLVATEASKSSPIPYLPPDEPPGQMHLWWPPCVPYVTKRPDGHLVPVQPPEDDVPPPSTDEHEPPGESHRRHIYPQRLKEDEFRVMCLYPVEDVHDPIHASLEVEDDLRYHEFETVSYTWGGENGDSRLTQPVYIGPYWDILIQTHNCWEMLRHMRPWKGVRTIWVDAICINQIDMQERQEQVAKMGRIYDKASRLVIYLGPDLVPPTSISSPYPRRHHLQELDNLAEKPQLPSASLSSSKQWTLSDVLGREYFRRLWIIQELIMSRNINLRIGDTEFIVDRAVKAHGIPWFDFITQKSVKEFSVNGLRAAVELVDDSRASDPRDKIFGVLGLIDVGKHQIAAEYSISWRHLIIGYYAYCLLAKEDLSVLFKASGHRALEGMPSWAPPAEYDASRNEYIIPRTGNRSFQCFWEPIDFYLLYSRHHDFGSNRYPFMVSRSWSITDQHLCWKVAFEWNRSGTMPAFQSCWYSDATIDSSTGELNLTAIHIMSFGNIDFSEAEIESHGEVHFHTLKAGLGTLNIYASECILGLTDDPSKIHLFVLYDDVVARPANRQFEHTQSRLCLLEQVDGQAKFRLISASVIACFHVPYEPKDFQGTTKCGCDPDKYYPRDFVFSFERYRVDSDIFPAYGNGQTLPLPLLRPERLAETHFDGQELRKLSHISQLSTSITQPIDGPRQKWAGLDGEAETHNLILTALRSSYIRFPSPRVAFPKVNSSAIFLQLFQSILDAERSGSSAQFFNVYFQAVREFHPQLIRWKTQRKDTSDELSHGEVAVIDLVQLRFEPYQYVILEDILDSIQEDLKQELPLLQGENTSSIDEAHGQYSPPFWRIGWRDLTLNQSNEAMENSSLNGEDAYGFYGLDAINKMFDRKKPRYDEPHQTWGSKDWIYDDSVVREHREQTLWVAFDLLSLTLWAQMHPCTAELRGLSRFCKDGENEVARLLRRPTREEIHTTSLNWPPNIMEDFGVDGEFRSITII